MPSKQLPFLLLGKVLRPHGVRGEIRVDIMTAYPERIGPERVVHIGSNPDDPATAAEYKIIQARPHQQYLILQLAGITDRNAADRLREHYVMVPLEEAVPLEADEFYLFQAIGLAVYTDTGESLGQVIEILETGANDVYLVQGPRGEILLPAIEDCILDIDIEAGKMTVHLLDDLLGD